MTPDTEAFVIDVAEEGLQLVRYPDEPPLGVEQLRGLSGLVELSRDLGKSLVHVGQGSIEVS